ncbi:DoxX family protein [Marinibacterium profundimaris]|uniref:DoxX n=1 Tax=Marinibacterium profundimaris TaxID=1679460 RepID=A0A225NG91_9RHOB|nr:DoxX family protein [Marinibacterium profundimaris]OWU72559.1 DoxX [Marinibacterium profundimaris]
MHRLFSFHNRVFALVETGGDVLLPLLARFVFAAVLLFYFWHSAVTKLGDGIFGFLNPSTGAYAQIFPKQMESVSYDVSQLGTGHWLVAVLGTWAEFLLPALIVLGLFTRLAALGMIGFVVIQSLTDVYGLGQTDAQSLGAWFDGASGSLILDQRSFWIFLLLYLVAKGGGLLSVDALLRRVMPPGLR